MRFQATTGNIKDQRTACLLLPVYRDAELPVTTRAANTATGGLIENLISAGDLRPDVDNTLLVATTGHRLRSSSVLLVGCGARKKFDTRNYRRATAAAYRALRKTKRETVVSCLPGEAVKGTDPYRRARLAAELWHDVDYRFTAMKSEPDEQNVVQKSIAISARSSHLSQVRKGIRHGDAVGRAMSFARDLGNLPANVCTPGYLAQQARALARGDERLRVQVLNEKDMGKLGMGALLSVTAGTKEPAKFIVIKYSSGSKKKPVVIVGKGITFDAGGISLKPPPAMDEMKYDMGGAAAVLGVMQAVRDLSLPGNVIGIVPSCENLPSGTATKPGDIVRSMSGQTIEILNTDAEGRLILADALTYAKRFEPEAVIDIATLTGACLVALGRHRTGLLSNDDRLARAVLKAGEDAGDPAWQLPIGPEYARQLKSNFADVANIGGREAGTVTAACFLERFVGEMPWVHLDVAGTAWQTGSNKGSTGRPIPLLVEYLLTR